MCSWSMYVPVGKEGKILKFYILNLSLLGAYDVSGVRWTYSPSLVTVSPPKLFKRKWDVITYKQTDDLTRAPRGTDRSPEYNEHFCYKLDSKVKILTTEWNEKQQHFITHASRSLLWIQFVAVAFHTREEVFWRRGPPWPTLPRSGSAPDMAKTSVCMCWAMSTSSLPSFINFH